MWFVRLKILWVRRFVVDRKLVIAVDIDGTLCEEYEFNWHDYSVVEPKEHAIAKVNLLYEIGHKIVLYTARWGCDRCVTEEWLVKYGVKYHDLIMDKLKADVYVDDSSYRIDDFPIPGKVVE